MYFTDKQIYKLAKIIYNVLYESHPSLTSYINYLKSIIKFLKNLNLNNVWLSPTGIIVEQRYVEMIKSTYKSSILGKKEV